MNKHPIVWTQPAPLWPQATAERPGQNALEFSRPCLLRFASDDFMDDFLDLLSTDPSRLGEYRARPETWRGFLPPPAPASPQKAFARPTQRRGIALRNAKAAPLAAPPEEQRSRALPLKLYQPVHGRFYLVAACLVCETPGLPDRRVDSSHEETASFVLRRLLPPGPIQPNLPLPELDEATWEEHAFITGPRGSFWQKIKPLPETPPNAAPELSLRRVLEGEERLPLFGTRFAADDQRERRLLAGTIPAGRREAYMAAPAGDRIDPRKAPGTSDITARKNLFRTLVSEPWKALVDLAAQLADGNKNATPIPPSTDSPSKADFAKAIDALRDQIQTASWLIMADFVDFLRTYLPALHDALADPASTPGGRIGDALAGLRGTALSSMVRTDLGPPSGLASSLADALSRFIHNPTLALDMEEADIGYRRGVATPGWPDFLFPLADPNDLKSALPPENPSFTDSLEDDGVDIDLPPSDHGAGFKRAIDHLAALIISALPAQDSTPAPAPSAAAQKPCDLRQGWFVLRCVYERPACGPLHDDVVSARTEPFQIAGFFDPDAPARPIRIGLPLDTTPAGLRKFDKNTAFMMSDVLCGQLKRLKGMTFGGLIRTQLPWPLHKELSVPDGGACTNAGGTLSLGTVCSLSIPIITICALILLIIMVALLDIIFRWMPYFIICFPLPGLKGKKT